MDDKEQLERICEIFTEYLPPWEGSSLKDLQDSLENGAFVAAISGSNNIIGAAVWEWRTDFGELDYLCIDGRHQGKGYGRQLIDYIINDIRSMMIPGAENFLYLDVAQENSGAKEFYIRYGFEVEYLRKVFEKTIKK